MKIAEAHSQLSLHTRELVSHHGLGQSAQQEVSVCVFILLPLSAGQVHVTQKSQVYVSHVCHVTIC